MYKGIDTCCPSKCTGPKLVFKILSEAEYIEDPINTRFEIVKEWANKMVEERSTIIDFIRGSSP
jgi:hypothetical protein